VSSKHEDDLDIMKQTRSLYVRANTIIHKFSNASLDTKVMLFTAHCTQIYGSPLWSSMFQYSYNKLYVLHTTGHFIFC